VQNAYFEDMKASLSELHRETAKIIRPVIHGGKTLTLTDRGQDCAKVIPIPKIDRKAAWKAIKEIGPVNIKPRK
jgi:antitoxin (DNA-binding transcriptional repressor) of toxin-antitoxin stability system